IPSKKIRRHDIHGAPWGPHNQKHPILPYFTTLHTLKHLKIDVLAQFNTPPKLIKTLKHLENDPIPSKKIRRHDIHGAPWGAPPQKTPYFTIFHHFAYPQTPRKHLFYPYNMGKTTLTYTAIQPYIQYTPKTP
ncbi:MAG: hypothetical protein ACRCZI_07175, partial [Cetobacterium sp.]